VLFPDQEVKDLPELLSALALAGAGKRPLWYRGQSKREWGLLPSLARVAKGIEAEPTVIKRFKQNALPFLERPPTSEWEWLFLMQHHGAPTRLLDWSEYPLAALYFAVTEHPDQDACLWCLDPVSLNEASFVRPKFKHDIPCLAVDDELDDYLPSAHSGLAKKPPIAALAMRHFPRIAAQAGVFTITHFDQTPIEEVDGGEYVGRLVIPKDAKGGLAASLALLGIQRLSLFPELESVSRLAREVLS
jgi:FRG domain-containing protein